MIKKVYKYISLKPFNHRIFYKNKIFKINNGHNIFFDLKIRLKTNGVMIDTIDVKRKLQVDKYIYSDVPYPWSLGLWLKIFIYRRKNELFCFESPLVNPFNHLRLLHLLFNHVYTWNDLLVDNKKYFKFFIPQLRVGINTKPKEYSDRKFLVCVLSNKSVPTAFQLASPFKKNLYKERVHAIEFFDNKAGKEFSLYGFGWNKPKPYSLKEKLFGFKKFKNYKGETSNKIKLISKFKFCLAFENAVAPGYITEKIFDCFKAGCVPIYFGAPNVGKYIPEECFIDPRNFDSYEDLLIYLNSIDENEYKRYIKVAQTFLRSKKTLCTWFEEGFKRTFFESIEK